MSPSPDDAIARRALRRLGASLCGRYSILRLIGIGGMAAVYAGVHRNGHAVAIKILHERLVSDPEIERLFRREAQLANRINHPGVVPVIDDDVAEDGCVFLVMPLLQGETLRARAERKGRKLPVEEVVVLAHSLLQTLAEAHAKRIVHRDIKPENVFVTTGGEILVLDFGIGRFFETAESTSATRSGRALGTPAFMAPEQALGRMRDVDGRTDLWAVGATMYSLLTGRFVHEAESPTEIAVLAATKPARAIAELAPDVPAAIGAVIDKALAFKREDRWSDAEEMDRGLLRACEVAFGGSIGKLPGIAAPQDEHVDDVEGVPTRVPEVGGGLAGEGDEPRVTTEEIRGVSTRTMPEQVAGAGKRQVLRLRSLRIWLGGVALVIIASASLLRVSHSWQAPAQESHAVAAAPDGNGIPFGFDPKAVDAYASGLALWHAASPNDAVSQFAHAAEIEPSFAAAHLYVALLSPFVRTSTRSHFAHASEYASGLSPFQGALLRCLAPAMRERPDWNAAIQSISELQGRFPHEPELPLIIAHRLRLLFAPAKALAAVEGADPTIPLVWSLRANALVQLDKLDDARFAFARCLELAPASTSCSQMLMQLESNEGHCERTEALARQVIARAPDSPTGYEFLAGALFGTTRSLEATEAVMAQRLARLDPSEREMSRWSGRFSIAILDGDTDAAGRALDAWEADVSALHDSSVHGSIAYDRMLLAQALGEDNKLASLARRYLTLSKAWGADDSFDLRMCSLRLLYQAGGLTRDAFRVERDAWLRDPGEALRFVQIPSFTWVEAYAAATKDADDAADALLHLPAEHPYFMPHLRNAGMDEMIGRTFLFAQQFDEAKRHLTRATSSCTIENPIEQTQAELELAAVNEELGDRGAACVHYREVARRWAHNHHLLAGKMASAALNALHCDHIEQANPH